jgi:hypothetical protein
MTSPYSQEVAMRGLRYADKVAVITGGRQRHRNNAEVGAEAVRRPCLFIESEATFTTGVDHLISGGAELDYDRKRHG